MVVCNLSKVNLQFTYFKLRTQFLLLNAIWWAPFLQRTFADDSVCHATLWATMNKYDICRKPKRPAHRGDSLKTRSRCVFDASLPRLEHLVALRRVSSESWGSLGVICPHSSRDANESRGKTNYSVAQSCDLLLHTISDQARSATLNALFHLIHIRLLSFSEFVNLNLRLGRSDVNCTHRLPFINNYSPNLAKCALLQNIVKPRILLPRSD